MIIKNLCILVHWIKVALALDRLIFPEIIVWSYGTFDNNNVKNIDLMKYLKESCWQCFSNIFLSNIFLTMLLSSRFHQNCQTVFGVCDH